MPSTTAVAYLSVILIWATTPLAIQWSATGLHFLTGLTGRMLIGIAVIAVLFGLTRKKLPLTAPALRIYLAGGLGIFCAMLLVYWSSGYIPSGWISVIFGLSPIFTGFMARLWLNEDALTPFKLLSMALGLAGLAIIFGASTGEFPDSKTGVVLVLLSTLIHSASGVWVKKLNHSLDGLSVTYGSLVISVPLFIIAWIAFAQESPPETIPVKAGVAMIYLGVFGSVIGFSLYYFLLTKMSAGRIALITLVTPVLALFLGHWVNSEPLSAPVYYGTALVLSGLAVYEWHGFTRAPKINSGN